uniref:(northern house mosquito) hypothetical protein n=1 Tax=Culex pipiens TaxID=7175 RepID=A0A8D8C1I5_CULPI
MQNLVCIFTLIFFLWIPTFLLNTIFSQKYWNMEKLCINFHKIPYFIENTQNFINHNKLQTKQNRVCIFTLAQFFLYNAQIFKNHKKSTIFFWKKTKILMINAI